MTYTQSPTCVLSVPCISDIIGVGFCNEILPIHFSGKLLFFLILFLFCNIDDVDHIVVGTVIQEVKTSNIAREVSVWMEIHAQDRTTCVIVWVRIS